MTPREIVWEQIRHRETPRIPYTLGFEPDVAARIDAHYGGAVWRESLIPYMARTSGIARPVLAEPLPRVVDAFGTVWRRDELPPVVLEPALKAPSFHGYAFPTVDDLVPPEAVPEALQRVREAGDSFTVVNTGICLWQGWYIRGFEETLVDCVAHEEFYAELLDRMTQLTLDVIEKCAGIPADAIMMGDDWGDQRGPLIGPERWRRFYKPRYARIFQAVHDQGKVALLHCCGSVAEIMGDIVEIGLDVLESVQPEAAGMNPYELKKQWGDNITFWGGLGSQSTIPFGTPGEIRREIARLRTEMSQGGGYILAPAKGLRPETPTANAVAVLEAFLES